MIRWFNNNDLNIQNLPLFQYCTLLPNHERSKVLWLDLWQLYTQKDLAHTKSTTSPKDNFMNFSADGFIQRLRYIDICMPHNACKAVGQLRVSSHQLKIEAGQAVCMPRAERFCKGCVREIKSEGTFCVGAHLSTTYRKKYATTPCGLYYH